MNPRVGRGPGRSRTAALAGLAVATLALTAACGGGASAVPATGTSSMPGMTMTMDTAAGSGSAPTAPAAPVAGNAVTIMNFAFAPAALTVKAGTTVTWTNKDGDAHTVTSQGSGGPLGSAALATGQSYSFTFTKPGTYSYLCTIHPFMTATVTVTP